MGEVLHSYLHSERLLLTQQQQTTVFHEKGKLTLCYKLKNKKYIKIKYLFNRYFLSFSCIRLFDKVFCSFKVLRNVSKNLSVNFYLGFIYHDFLSKISAKSPYITFNLLAQLHLKKYNKKDEYDYSECNYASYNGQRLEQKFASLQLNFRTKYKNI